MNLFTEIKIWIKSIRLTYWIIRNDVLYIIRKGAIGDILWTEPVIRKLAGQGNEILYVNGAPELFENYPFKNIKFVHKDKKEYKRIPRILKFIGKQHLFIELDNAYEKDVQTEPTLHVYQRTAGLPTENTLPIIHLTDTEKQLFSNNKPYVVVHIEFPIAKKNHKQIHGIEWQAIFDYLNLKGFDVYLIAQEKTNYQQVIQLQTSLREMFSLVLNARFFIGLDSGPSNIAEVLRVPQIVFFGSVNPSFWRLPEYFDGIIMQQPCEYAGCFHRAKKTKKDYSCLLIGDEGSPKCCLFKNEELIAAIDTMTLRIADKNPIQ